jgi:hypothetical protein
VVTSIISPRRDPSARAPAGPLRDTGKARDGES